MTAASKIQRRQDGGLKPLALLILMAAPLLALGAQPAATEPPLRFLPHWIPQAQFAGYYMADSKGFYRQEGLNITVLKGGPQQPPDRALAENKTDFSGLFLSTAVVRRAEGQPLINLAQLIQRSSLMLVARKSSGIRRPEDLDRRKVSLWSGGFEIQPRALFRNCNIHPVIVPQGSTINLFLRGGVDAASAMWYNEYHLLLAAGLDEEDLVLF
ncbi:MAG: ABC transporter substrate-binding protein, partial [Lentisphaeria bacterium]